MKKFVLALVLSCGFASQALALDPCRYQVSQEGCFKLTPYYGCSWEPEHCYNVNGGGRFDPCRYQNQRGCARLAFQGCRWAPGICVAPNSGVGY